MLCCGSVTCRNVHICLVFIHICTLDCSGYRDCPLHLGNLHHLFSRIFLPGWLVRVTSLHVSHCIINFIFDPQLWTICIICFGWSKPCAYILFFLSQRGNFDLSFRLTGNLSATAFPLFTSQMYNVLGYKWGNTLLGCLAAIMVPIPFVRLICV